MQRPTRLAFCDRYSGIPRKRLGGLCGHNNALATFGVPNATVRLWWGERRHKSPADLAERYQPFATLSPNAKRLLTLVIRCSET